MTHPDPQAAPPETDLRDEEEQLCAAIEAALKYLQRGAAVQTMRVAVTILMEAVCTRPDTFLPDYLLRRLARPDALREKVMDAMAEIDEITAGVDYDPIQHHRQDQSRRRRRAGGNIVREKYPWMRDDQVETWETIAQLIAGVDDKDWPDVRMKQRYDKTYRAAARIVSWLDDRERPDAAVAAGWEAENA
jgi:hypothetical protein